MHVCVCTRVHVHALHMCANACRGQNRVLNPLELELQAIICHLMWVLGTKLQSSARALNSGAIQQAPQSYVLINYPDVERYTQWSRTSKECLKYSLSSQRCQEHK